MVNGLPEYNPIEIIPDRSIRRPHVWCLVVLGPRTSKTGRRKVASLRLGKNLENLVCGCYPLMPIPQRWQFVIFPLQVIAHGRRRKASNVWRHYTGVSSSIEWVVRRGVVREELHQMITDALIASDGGKDDYVTGQESRGEW